LSHLRFSEAKKGAYLMLAIKKTMPDYFTVLLESGVVHVDGVDQLVKILERTLDISIYSSSEEQKALDEISSELEDAQNDIAELTKKMNEFKKKRSGDNS